MVNDALKTNHSFHDEPPSMHENLTEHDPVYRWLISMTTAIVGSLYVGIVAATYVTLAVPLVLTGGLMVQCAFRAPSLVHRHDPLFDIWTDHLLLVLDEPAILVSYRLNDLFGRFDPEILRMLQLRWYLGELNAFHAYLDVLKSEDDELLGMTEEQHRVLIKLVGFLRDVPTHLELVPEAISRMREWMEVHSAPVQAK